MKNVLGTNAGVVEIGFTLAQGTRMYGSYAKGLLATTEAHTLASDNVYAGAFKKCNCDSEKVASGECRKLLAA